MKSNNSLLSIKKLNVLVGQRQILEDVDLDIGKGEVHALIGPNGHGKSTLMMTLMSHFAYEVQSGSILFKNENIVGLEPDEISKKGIFMAFQNPIPIPGLKTIDFLKSVVNAHQEKPISTIEYFAKTKKNINDLSLDKGILEREVNVNFSGGEKKKHEILQMLMLKNDLVLLDEIDSGLDVDNINEIIKIVNRHRKETGTSYLIVSHYDKMFNTMDLDWTHVIYNKQLKTTEGSDFISKVHNVGYQKVIDELEFVKPSSIKV